MKHFEHHPTIVELGAMEVENRAATRRHLAACTPCRTRLAELEHVRQALASTAPIDLTPSRILTDGALMQLHRQKAKAVRVNGLLSVVSAIFAAFVMLLPRHKASAAASVLLKDDIKND